MSTRAATLVRVRSPAGDRMVQAGLNLHAGAVFLFLYAPIVIVVIFAFNDNRDVAAWTHASFRWFGEAARDETLRRSFFVSLWTASANAGLATLLGTAAALGLRNVGRRARLGFDAFLYTSLIVPEIVIAIASLLFFSTINFPLGGPAIVLTHSLFNMSVVTLMVRARLAGMDRSLEEASVDLGATRWGTFRQITLLQIRPAILAGTLLSFTFSFDDVVLSQFMSAPGATTLPIRVFSELRFGLRPTINVVSTFMLALTLTAIVVAQLILRRGGGGPLAATGPGAAA